jgi:MerR family transcriptional regulator, light-induced transcriptional regulator
MQKDGLSSTLNIEFQTGFSKDLLRKWRQRYGFPMLETGADGVNGYSPEAISQLVLIKRLLEAGFRPAQIVTKTTLELERLCSAIGDGIPNLRLDKTTRRLIEQLRNSDFVGFQSLLDSDRSNRTLTDFVLSTIVPLINEIGEAWLRKEIDIYHEHLCTTIIKRILGAEILSCKPKRGFPRILFATPPEERHSLGLLMIEAVLADQGSATFCVGTHTPLNDIKLAAIACKTEVVALSFSFAYSKRNIRPTLVHLRQLLPAHMEIWAGGAGVQFIRHAPKGVRIFSDLQEAVRVQQAFVVQGLKPLS